MLNEIGEELLETELSVYEMKLIACREQNLIEYYKGCLHGLRLAKDLMDNSTDIQNSGREKLAPRNVQKITIPITYGGKLPVGPERQ